MVHALPLSALQLVSVRELQNAPVFLGRFFADSHKGGLVKISSAPLFSAYPRVVRCRLTTPPRKFSILLSRS
jgi:hypothetical protein